MADTDTKANTEDILAYVTRLGDDALVLGHRLSEWTSNGPFLEEDIAMGNVALDYIGRARMLYTYAAELKTALTGEEASEDDFAYLRSEREFQNHLIYELPKGDFAFTIVRQFLVDQYHALILGKLCDSADETIAAIARKAIKETAYHLRRSKNWVLRLGDGTEESHSRMLKAIDDIWGYTHELFEQDELEQRLVVAGVAVEAASIKNDWQAAIKVHLQEATLCPSTEDWAVRGGREGYHTENLGHLLAELQYVHRAYPGCNW